MLVTTPNSQIDAPFWFAESNDWLPARTSESNGQLSSMTAGTSRRSTCQGHTRLTTMPLVVSLRRAGVAYDVQLNHRVPPKVSQKWIRLGTKVCSRGQVLRFLQNVRRELRFPETYATASISAGMAMRRSS